MCFNAPYSTRSMLSLQLVAACLYLFLSFVSHRAVRLNHPDRFSFLCRNGHAAFCWKHDISYGIIHLLFHFFLSHMYEYDHYLRAMTENLTQDCL